MTFVFWHITPKRNSRYDNVVWHTERLHRMLMTMLKVKLRVN